MVGQGYGNGSNMKDKHQGVQRKLLDVNHIAYTHHVVVIALT